MGGIGYAGGNSAEILRNNARRIEHIGIVAFMLLVAGWVFYKRLRNKRSFEQRKPEN
jgi:membrane protein DedA with SNARE-associated domain